MRITVVMKALRYTAMNLMIFACCIVVQAQDSAAKKEDSKSKREELRRKYEEEIARAREKVKPLLEYDIEVLKLALRIKTIDKFSDAKIAAKDTVSEKLKYLGTIESSFGAESIFNEFGTYGSRFSADSIWNTFGEYGGQFSAHSPFNKFSTDPPMIIKNRKIIGYLTINKTMADAVDPNWLSAYFKN
jgi:hypothetical protein